MRGDEARGGETEGGDGMKGGGKDRTKREEHAKREGIEAQCSVHSAVETTCYRHHTHANMTIYPWRFLLFFSAAHFTII